MPHTKAIILLGTFVCMALTSGFAQSRADERTGAYLKKFSADEVRSMLDKKPEELQGYYAENIRLMPEFQKTVMGKNQTLTYYRAFAGRFSVRAFSSEAMEILDLGPMVTELGVFAMNVTLKSTGKVHELKGKYQRIWEKRQNGEPLLRTQAWNYNHQLEIEDQLRFAEVPTVDIALTPHLPINSPISFELAALNLLMETTISAHDANLWSQFYAEDGMFYYSRHPVCEGRKALDAFFEKHVKDIGIFEKLNIRNDRVDVLGTYVIEYASHIASWRGGEYSGVGLGKDLRIWRREKNGSLKIFRHFAMYD